MGFASRVALASGIGIFLFSIFVVLGVNGTDLFISDFYTFTGLAALTLYILDYLNYWLAT